MAKAITLYECDFCGRDFDNIKEAKLHEANCFKNQNAPINEKKYQWLFKVSTSGTDYTYPLNITAPMSEGEFLSKYGAMVGLVSYTKINNSTFNMTRKNEPSFFKKLERAVSEQILDCAKTGIEECLVKVDDKNMKISFNHSIGEIIILGENNV